MTESPPADDSIPSAANEAASSPPLSGDSSVATSVLAPAAVTTAPTQRKSSGLGTAALVLGIIGIVFAVIPFVSGFGLFLGVVALVLGIIGLVTHGGRAIAGTILGGTALVLGLIFSIVYAFAAVGALNSVSDSYSSQSVSGQSSGVSKPTKPAAPAGTVSEDQALISAKEYLSEGTGFSEAGLFGQLSSKYGEGFSKADAQWAVDHSGADWNAQALDSARNYLSEGTGFSKAGLTSQLSSHDGEQFTKAQAKYGVDNSDADWNAQAVDSAKGYLKLGGFSRGSLISQLTSRYGEQFTQAQAVYAVDKVGL